MTTHSIGQLLIEIRHLTVNDEEQVKFFLVSQNSSIPHGFFYEPNDSIISKCLNSETGISLGAFLNNKLVAIRLTYIPKLDKENHGYSLNFTENELLQVAQFHGTVVLNDIRLKGLGETLVRINAVEILSKGYKYVLVTVHPENIQSIKMFIKNRFKIVAFKNKYNNLPRYILCKKEEVATKESNSEIKLPLDDIRKIIEKLEAGYCGTFLSKFEETFLLTLEKGD